MKSIFHCLKCGQEALKWLWVQSYEVFQEIHTQQNKAVPVFHYTEASLFNLNNIPYRRQSQSSNGLEGQGNA